MGGVKENGSRYRIWVGKLSEIIHFIERGEENKTVMIQVNFACEGDKWMKLAQDSIQDQALGISEVAIFVFSSMDFRISVTYS